MKEAASRRAGVHISPEPTENPTRELGSEGPMSGTEARGCPLVSLVVPTLNRCELLKETLTSFRQQSYPHWEALVVDDGSSDGTLEMLAATNACDPRIRLLKRDRSPAGAPSCRNIGVAAAKGEYVILFDSDDLMAPHCLERRVGFMKDNPHLDFAVFQAQMFRSAPGDLDLVWNCETGEDHLDRFLGGDVPWHTASPIWRREAFRRVGPWDEDLLCSQDHEYHTRAVLAGLRYVWLPEVDFAVRAVQATHLSIGTHWQSRDHLLSQWVRIRKLAGALAAAGLLVGRRRELLAGNYFWLADSLARYADSPAEARQVWAECRRDGHIRARRYCVGRIYLGGVRFLGRLHLGSVGTRRLRSLARLTMHQIWPEEMFAFRRGLQRRAPIELQGSAGAAMAYKRRNRRVRAS
jgi:glycosyltransferase involved in cell wall biosynthesis